MIEVCNLTLSVETAVMHLASCLDKPLIALMREKAENWKPLVAETILYAKQNVNDIGLEEVTSATSEVIRKIANGRN